MVKLADVKASNARIATELPPGLVAVFVGGTSGLGEYSVLAFAKHALRPKIYIIGRSQTAADRIIAECEKLNPEGQYAFMQTDASLLKNVDDACRQLREKEKAINVLFLSIGNLVFGVDTPEGLPVITSLQYYARMRFVANLLPQIRAASHLRRVVTAFAGTKEGAVDVNDLFGRKVSLVKARGHVTSMMTLTLEQLARSAPEVSFVHDYPGPVRSNIARDFGAGMRLLTAVGMAFLTPFLVPTDESGERHVFLSTSAAFPAHGPADGSAPGADGVAIAAGQAVAGGTDGEVGSGVYTVDERCESGSPAVRRTLARLREDGTAEAVWAHTVGEFERITGTAKLV
ncbi:hypothetical protein RB595_003414 [Gaeumannomyces hyphopodioides]